MLILHAAMRSNDIHVRQLAVSHGVEIPHRQRRQARLPPPGSMRRLSEARPGRRKRTRTLEVRFRNQRPDRVTHRARLRNFEHVIGVADVVDLERQDSPFVQLRLTELTAVWEQIIA